jgi:hypothetical protein
MIPAILTTPRYCPVCDRPVDPAHDGRVPPHRSSHGYPCRGEALNPAELPAALKYGGETR